MSGLGERWTAVAFVVVAVALGLVGFVITDERFRILLWILAIPIGLSGLAVLVWANASGEVQRFMKDKR